MRQRHTEEGDARLRALLRLKRMEVPGAAFWEGFERELEKKVMRSVVVTPSGWCARLLDRGISRVRPSSTAWAVSMGVLVTGLLLWWAWSLAEESMPGGVAAEEAWTGGAEALYAGAISTRFMVDAWALRSDTGRSWEAHRTDAFRKTAESEGHIYVSDRLSIDEASDGGVVFIH